MNVGLIGTGAIAHKHAESYAEIGYNLAAVCDLVVEKGKKFAEKYGADFVGDLGDLCRRDDIDYIDVCTFPNSHLPIVKEAVANGKHVLLQKPIALTLEASQEMMDLAKAADLRMGSQPSS